MDALEQQLLTIAGSQSIRSVEEVQSLWSGYGAIKRYRFDGGELPSLIVKHVTLPDDIAHPRGWNTNRSHERKVRSYQVETNWYKHFAGQCDDYCQVPRTFPIDESKLDPDAEYLIILEDLNAVSFSRRFDSLTYQQMQPCIQWLAHFHARFMGVQPQGLWPSGTYWHLETRPDELDALDDLALKSAAGAIDQKLKASPFQTLLHGDAKLANFCFSEDGAKVAAVDFQYVGAGCGMKDLAYFIGSCLYEDDCEKYEAALLDDYFLAFADALDRYSAMHLARYSVQEIEASWRPLFKYAWADFHRFVKGWSPGHWKINSYSERLSKEVVDELN
ncbi:choline kinase [Oleiphilus sp. HI0125]|uniref:phosphotransferase family protein n=1 Tax=Oleiphilus sp. HI0125 TaxID=1822266 RepID=UPI0007C2F6DD|nr:phosphotransferase [Oleiphilus sp. HI0125]KZZ57118.1 choline kinase [Oleiphilus sp. HI0125]